MSSNRRGKRQRRNGCIADNKRTGRRNLGRSARRSKSLQGHGGLEELMHMEAFHVDMGDACGGPVRMDVKDGDGKNGLSDGGGDCGGCKAGDRNSPRDG